MLNAKIQAVAGVRLFAVGRPAAEGAMKIGVEANLIEVRGIC
jgi:uroporphyrinogen-III synthase